MRRSLGARLLPLALLLVPATIAAAQETPPDPLDSAAARLGPIGLTPTLVIRDIGRDYNVFNEATNPKQDFTATVSPRLDLLLHSGPLLLTNTTTTDYVYYRKYASERGTNLGTNLRLDVTLGPVRPFAAIGAASSRDRLNREIDVRARHHDRSYAGGVRVQLLETVFATVSARQVRSEFDEHAPEFRGVNLATTLDEISDAIDAGAGVAVTPLTTIQVIVTRQRERFQLSPDRDSDTFRVMPTVTFSPLAILSGSASLGYRKFTPTSAQLPSFSGFVSSVALNTTIRDRHRVEATFSRDLQYSAEESASVYIETGAQATWTWHLAGPLDWRLSGGRSRLHYQSPLLTASTDEDVATTYGASIGVRVRERMRLGFNADWRRRDSERSADRAYRNRRIYANLTWGRQ